MEAAAGSGVENPESVPGLRLRAHLHRSRDDGGRQRSRAPRGERHPRRRRVAAPPGAACGSCTSPRSSRRGASSTHSLLAGPAVGRHARAPRAVAVGGDRQDAIQRSRAAPRSTALAKRAPAACRCPTRRSGRSPTGRRRPGRCADIRRQATKLVERIVRLVAVRLAEAQGAGHGATPPHPAVGPRRRLSSESHPEVGFEAMALETFQADLVELSRDDARRLAVGRAATGAAPPPVRAAGVVPVALGQGHPAGALPRDVPGVRRRRRGRARRRPPPSRCSTTRSWCTTTSRTRASSAAACRRCTRSTACRSPSTPATC